MNFISDEDRAALAARVRPFARPRYAASALGVLVIGMVAFARMAPPADAPAALDLEAAASRDAGAEAGAGTSLETAPVEPAPPMPGPTERLETYEQPELMATPEPLRGIYVTAYSAGAAGKRARLIELARETEINTFVIDVKEVGHLSYRSTVALARRVGADSHYAIPNMRAVLQEIRDAGIYPVARIVVFRDEVLAEARPDLSIVKEDGSIWQDNNGYGWVDSFNREVWDYNITIAREAIEMGFAEVQWDYVRFPDVPQSYMKTAVWPAREGRTKEDGIAEFLRYSREQLADLGVPVTADVFGLATSAADDLGIGQNWKKMRTETDALLPMIYPSHYARGSYGIQHPNANPYDIVFAAMEWARKRTEGVEGAARVRPWLQDFSLGEPDYGPAYVRAQIEAVYDAGFQDWILWNAASNYTAEALAPERGRAPRFPIPRADSADADRDGRRGGPVGRRMRVRPDTSGVFRRQ